MGAPSGIIYDLERTPEAPGRWPPLVADLTDGAAPCPARLACSRFSEKTSRRGREIGFRKPSMRAAHGPVLADEHRNSARPKAALRIRVYLAAAAAYAIAKVGAAR